jgi:tyrosine-protein kinase Etk/Wzc
MRNMADNHETFASSLDYKKVINRLFGFRNVYIVLFVVAFILAYLVNKYSSVSFENSIVLNLSQDKSQSPSQYSTDLFQTVGLFNTQQNIENELEILKSFSLIKRVLSDFDLKTSYFSYNDSPLSSLLVNTPFVRKSELYNLSPIEVVIDQSLPQAIYLNFFITLINENEFTIEATGKNVALYNYIDDQVVSYADQIIFKQRAKFGDEVKTKYFSFRVQKSAAFSPDYTTSRKLYFFLNNINNLTLQYQGSLTAQTTSETSTLIKVSLTGTNGQRITDFLNNLSSAYLDKNKDKKNKTALSTIDFIDSQISEVADSLQYTESSLKNFRTAAGVMDLSFQGQQVFEQLSKLENERAGLEVQRKYYVYLKNYITSNADATQMVAPSAMNVVDPILGTLVTQLINLNSERASLLNNATNQQNLFLADVNIKIDNLKKTISETVKNTLNTLDISLKEINARMSRASGQISQMPKTELQLRGIERKFKLNDEIYTFLLQKRAEAQIARASNMPDYEVVDQAIITRANVVSPKKMLNYLIAFFLAFILPTGFILSKDFLNNSISDPEEVESIAAYPILGRIFHNFHRTKQVVNEHPNSSVTESFRAVRTNFQFFSEGGKRQVMLITSTSSGEGKTFCSINLASVFALNNYKTVLLEFDLRRPKIHQEFGSTNIIGISSFLIDKANIEDIILPTSIENLDLISAGPAAPNPAELISLNRTAELIDKLKEMYDYIIIDSAPAGILTETQLLMKYADLNIFVVRMDKTIREALRNSMRSLQVNKITNISMLINDLNIKREAYRYGYDQKYYTDDKSSGFWYRLFKKKSSAS